MAWEVEAQSICSRIPELACRRKPIQAASLKASERFSPKVMSADDILRTLYCVAVGNLAVVLVSDSPHGTRLLLVSELPGLITRQNLAAVVFLGLGAALGSVPPAGSSVPTREVHLRLS